MLSSVLAPEGQARDVGDGRPVLLLVHGGGFVYTVFEMRYAERVARRLGFRARFVTYPNNLPDAVRTVRDVAASVKGDVYAYGESVGGTMAALLAQGRLVRAASTYCPVASMTNLVANNGSPELYQAIIGASDEDLRIYSPGRFDSPLPIFAMRAVDDSAYANQAIRSWDQRDADVTSVAVEGEHLGGGDPLIYRRNARIAIRWLAGAAGLAPPERPHYTY